jgi:hypothetical protein
MLLVLCTGSEGTNSSLLIPSFSLFSLAFTPLSDNDAHLSLKPVCPLLFRLVAIEDSMGKSLTGGVSRRYLWALFVACIGRQPGQGRKQPEIEKQER